MPELPEVETIVRDLNSQLKNKKIIAIESRDKKVFGLAARPSRRALNKPIKAVRRRGKMIIIDLGVNYLLFHLKMTGQLVFKSKSAIIAGGHPLVGQGGKLPNKFTRVIFKFNQGGKLYFNDLRRFGWVRLVDKKGYSALTAHLGVEPLSRGFSPEFFKKFLSRKPNTTVKQALLDQRYLAGIGNIYADESLFAARLKPFRRVKTLKPAEINRLRLAITRILKSAIKHRGTSFSDYVDAQGEAGNFVKYLKVYGRAGEKCKSCGGSVKKIKLGGRGTHWCSSCQK